MNSLEKPEVWQRGPVDSVIGLLQPVAHALLQAQEEIENIVTGFPDALLWQKPCGVASAGFHIQHITGVIDRLFTYADKKQLEEKQLIYLNNEGKQNGNTAKELMKELNERITTAIDKLKKVNAEELTETRTVGRKQIPSTLIGLYFHAAEHSMRHTGQLMVTAAMLKAQQL